MSRLQQSTQQRLSALAGRNLPLNEFCFALIAELSQAIPNDGYRLLGFDPGTGFVNRVLAASENDDWARRAWFRDAYLSSEPLTYIEPPSLMRWRITSVAVQERQEQCWGFHRDAFGATSPDQHYRGFYENECPVGGTLIGMFAAGGRWVATLQLYRREKNMPFQRADVAFLRLMAPQIGQTILRTLNDERARLECVDTGADSKGILILERGGVIRFMTPFGEALLRRLEQADHPRDHGLPAAISSVIAAMKAADPLESSRSLVASTPTGPVRVEGSPGGSDGSIAIILSPQLKPQIPSPSLDWPLTRQEREVAGRIMLGFSNREIAANLFISENTVQTHVRHIFDKLDVSRRSQLSARFFREVYLPGLTSDPEN